MWFWVFLKPYKHIIVQFFCYTEATPQDFATQWIHSYTRSNPQISQYCEGAYKIFAIFWGPLLIRMSWGGWGDASKNSGNPRLQSVCRHKKHA